MNFEALLDLYEEKFNKPYPLSFGSGKTEAEMIQEIKHCIDSGIEAEPPVYYDDVDY